MSSSEIGLIYGGRKGQEMGRLREQTVLAWLARWRYSTYHVLAVVMNISTKAAGEKLYKLEKKELVQKVKTLHARNHFVYRLTPSGLASFKQLSERETPEIPSPSDLSTNTRIPHDLSVQVAVAYLRNEGALVGFLTTFEFLQENKKNDFEAAVKPDSILIYKTCRTALELERRGKSDVRLLGKFEDMKKDYSKKEFGVFDNHHLNMNANQSEETEGFAYNSVLYINTDGAGPRYETALNTYYRRRSQRTDDPKGFFDGWYDSYEIQYKNELTILIESAVEESLQASSGVRDLL